MFTYVVGANEFDNKWMPITVPQYNSSVSPIMYGPANADSLSWQTTQLLNVIRFGDYSESTTISAKLHDHTSYTDQIKFWPHSRTGDTNKNIGIPVRFSASLIAMSSSSVGSERPFWLTLYARNSNVGACWWPAPYIASDGDKSALVVWHSMREWRWQNEVHMKKLHLYGTCPSFLFAIRIRVLFCVRGVRGGGCIIK